MRRKQAAARVAGDSAVPAQCGDGKVEGDLREEAGAKRGRRTPSDTKGEKGTEIRCPVLQSKLRQSQTREHRYVAERKGPRRAPRAPTPQVNPKQPLRKAGQNILFRQSKRRRQVYRQKWPELNKNIKNRTPAEQAS